MPTRKPLSPATTAVLHAIADGTRHGFEIMAATGLPSGTVYPILDRLNRDRLVRARWESAALAQRDKRPPRRYYEINAAGRRVLAHAVEYYRALGRAQRATGRTRG
jgi:PadR family transcriptional regulator PadR